MVRATRRQRPQKPTLTIRLLLAGAILSLTAVETAHQDAVSLIALDATPGARWQTTLVAGPVRADGTRVVRLAGPGGRIPAVTGPDDLIIVGSVSPTDPSSGTTRGGHHINRTVKGDVLVIRPQDITSGAFRVATLFAPPEVEPNLPRSAFLLPAPAGIMVAAAEPPKPAKNARGGKPAPAETPVVVAAAYAAADDDGGTAVKAPFDAVMADPKIPADANVVVKNPGAKHAWVNGPLPASARSASEKKCLATAIYFEARGEPEEGQKAVAQVVLNRVKNPTYPGTICGVVYQNKNMRNRCQFSFACDGIRDRVTDMRSWAKAQAIAEKSVNDQTGTFLSDVGASTHYHATYVRPRWARHMKKMDKVGRHIFYQTYGGGWS